MADGKKEPVQQVAPIGQTAGIMAGRIGAAALAGAVVELAVVAPVNEELLITVGLQPFLVENA
jgi:hypothetical protein